ncbi:MAG: hypothetical protein P0Y56_10490 [Candidatus Andeanibacterium colombiense]|uniref:Uncharacterized protein n=1 Tax=Candidatus Andeanibacterium colombiense TaxID=3121345 RepID=A0AAJ5X426_9SPHN|nr:MAG: hypothetical protein P0Y56_10490 [Sphingomonadaceae bacterium]
MSFDPARRDALALLGAGILGTLLPTRARAGAGEIGHLAPPAGPMRLDYRVRKSLTADAAIATERNFEIRFVPLTQGFRVEGRQISSAIDGPPELAPLAEVWRKTTLPGLFPFAIDASGLVVAGSGSASAPEPELGNAIDIALAMLRDGGSSEAQIADTRAFGQWLQRVADELGSDLPRDLFAPPATPQQSSRTIALPGGTTGTIEISFQGTLSPVTGLMREARREIVTRVEDTAQSTVEAWSLALSQP